MRQRLLAAIAVCLLASGSVVASDLVDLIPKDSYGYVVIANTADLDAKLQSLGKTTSLPIPSFLSMIEAKTKGPPWIDSDGSIGFAMLPTVQGPAAIMYVAVADYNAFIQMLQSPDTTGDVTAGSLWGSDIVVGRRGQYAIIAQPDGRESLLRILKSQGEANAIGDPKQQYDVAATVTSSGIQLLSGFAKQGLDQAKLVIKRQAGEDSPAIAGIELYDQMLAALQTEVSSLNLSIDIDDEGSIRFDNTVLVKPSGKLAPMLRELPQVNVDLLAGIPDIPYVFAGGGVIPKRAMQSMMEFSGSMMKSMKQMYAMESDQIDAMMKLSLKYFGDMQGMSIVVGVGQDDAPLYSNMLATIHVPDADEYLKNYRKYWDELSEVIADAEGSFLQNATLENMKFNGQVVLKLTMPFPQLAQVQGDNQADIHELIRKMYGSDAMTAYIAAADRTTVLVAYTGPEMLQKALDAADGKSNLLSNNSGLARTKQLLPRNPLMIGFWDVSGSIMFANRMMQMMPPPAAGFQIPDFPASPPVGWTMRVEPLTVSFQSVVPSETLDGLGSFVTSVKELWSAPKE